MLRENMAITKPSWLRRYSSAFGKWILGLISGEFVTDYFDTSTKLAELLPKYSSLIRDYMILIGISGGLALATVMYFDLRKRIRDRKESKRKQQVAREQEAQRLRNEKEKQIIESSVPKLDWLIDYHAPKFERGEVTNAGTNERASLYVDDLLAARLVHPKLSDRIKNRSPHGNYVDSSVLDYLPVVRERLAHRGLDDARWTVKEWPILVPVDTCAD